MRRSIAALIVGTIAALILPSGTFAQSGLPDLGQAFDRGAGNGNGSFTLADCPRYPSEDGDGQRICTGQVVSFDGTVLDVDLTLPDSSRGGQDGHPIIAMLHGFGGNKREWESTNNEGDGGDKWHWNSHWFAEQHGYYVLTYTARGFRTDPRAHPTTCTPPEGEPIPTAPYEPCTPSGSSDVKNDAESAVRLKHRDKEIKDTQWLAALVAKTFENANPRRTAVTGGSYGGGESWTQASQSQWTFPNECTQSDRTKRPAECRAPDNPSPPDFKSPLKVLDLQVAVPKYGWTDLAYSLAPNGHPGPYRAPAENCDVVQSAENDPCYSSSTGHPEDELGRGNPLGVLKESYVDFFYQRGHDPARTNEPGFHPAEADTWYEALNLAPGEPYDTNPVAPDARRGLTEERSSYYQDKQWKAQCGYDEQRKACGDKRKVAIFGIQGWTDDLFTAVEVFRQYKYLKDLDRRWPVELELADVGHPRAENRPETWRRLNQRAFGFVQSHIGGSHDDITTVASHPTVCANAREGHPDPNDPDQRLTAQTPEGLSEGKLSINYKTGGALTWFMGDGNGASTDPLLDTRVRGDCPVPVGPAPYTAVSEPLKEARLYVGLGSVSVPYVFEGQTGQLDTRIYDVTPDGEQVLISRGAYRINVPPDEQGAPDQAGELRIPLFGNQYHLLPGHKLRLDLTQVDAPFLRPSNVPSAIQFGPPTLTLPTRQANTTELGGERTDGTGGLSTRG